VRPIHWCAGPVLVVVCSKACAGRFQMLETSEHKQGVLAHAAQGATCVSPSASIAPCRAACAQCLDMNHTSPPCRAFRTTCFETLKSPRSPTGYDVPDVRHTKGTTWFRKDTKL